MASATENKLEIFFFPYLGGGHMIPMIDTARVFASHGVKSTVLTFPSNAHVLQTAIKRDQELLGHEISIHIFSSPTTQSLPIDSADMSAPPMIDTSMFCHSFELLLKQRRPDCVVLDPFLSWPIQVTNELAIPWINFNGSGCFPRCLEHCLRLHSPQDNIASEDEPFVIPGLPDSIEFTKSQVPSFMRNEFAERRKKLEADCFGVLINSFYELEPDYAEFYKREIKDQVWLIGPVSLCNKEVEDKAIRGQRAAIDENLCLNWLNSKKPNSVLYISFGSVAQLSPPQLREIADAIDDSDCFFIWVIGKIIGNEGESGVEELVERMGRSGRGLIIRGWAPQLLILGSAAVGGFLTHCGWNSTTEGICAGVPMITWPLSAEQFSNEKLITEVLRVGVKVGSKKWGTFDDGNRGVVGREKVREAIRRVMGGGDEVVEMRRRAGEYAAKARRAVEEGGSSYAAVGSFIEVMRSRRGESLDFTFSTT